MKTSSELFRFCLALGILLIAILYLTFSPNASPQAYFVLALGAIPVMAIGIHRLQKAKK
jgi:fucose permease